MTTSPALRINRPGRLNPLGPSAPFCLSACKFGIEIAHFPTLLFLRDTPVIVLEREIKTPKPVPAGTLGATFYVIKIWAQASCVLPLKSSCALAFQGRRGPPNGQRRNRIPPLVFLASPKVRHPRNNAFEP